MQIRNVIGTSHLIFLLLVGCNEPPPGDKPPPETSPPTTTTSTPQPVICDPPLSIAPAEAEVAPYQLLQLIGAGGTGQYRYALEAPSVGDINASAGTYIAPGEAGGADVVILTDTQCTGEATATISIVDGLTILPTAAQVLPNTAFDFELSGGVGSATCALVEEGSGGTVDAACHYIAGPSEGTDIIEAIDSSGATAQAQVIVTPDAALAPMGTERWVIPLGATFVPSIGGGSGTFELSLTSGSVTLLDETVVADAVGRSTVRVHDRFAGFEFEVDVEVVAPNLPDAEWVGLRTDRAHALSAGDLNGDGFDDVVFAIEEINAGSWDAGGVYVFAGGAAGPDPTPVQVFAGTQREQDLGTAITLADVDVDGQIDLVIGARNETFGNDSAGALHIHFGVAGGFFEDVPSLSMYGERSFDRLGGSVGACDLDGDGWPELIAGVDGIEDRSVPDFANSAGGVLVYRGAATGFQVFPTTTRYGLGLEGGQWIQLANAHVGEVSLAVGDLTGDGLCDVAVSSVDEDIEGNDIGDGYVLVYAGTPGDLLSPEPIRSYANRIDSNANFGWRVAIGNLDDDGIDDLVIGAHSWDGVDNGAGGVFAFLGSSDDGRPATQPWTPDEADWWVTAPDGDQIGRGLAVGDIDGDGVDDILTGAHLEDSFDSNAGQVRGWSGATLTLGIDAFDTWAWVWDGNEDNGRLGIDVAIGDVDGDGVQDLLAWAGRDNAIGLDVGRGYAYSQGTVYPMDPTGGTAGDKAGFALAWADIDGDGNGDMVVGAPQTNDPVDGALTGMVETYRSEGGSFSTTAVGLPAGIERVDSSDRYGEQLTGESDFDGDGWLDLSVGSRATASPGTFDETWSNPDGCPEGVGNSGAVLIHRGGPAGLDPIPSWVWFGTTINSSIEALRGGFDHNGDGRDDLVVGDEDWDVGGGFTVVYGVDPDPSGIRALCADPTYLALEDDSELGEALAPIGDLNGDGCDEIAVSADREDALMDDQGVVHVIWGHGPGCASNGPRKTAFGPLFDDVRAGESLDGGLDVDGDGLPDLVVGSNDMDLGLGTVGGVWLVPGSWIAAQPSQGYAQGAWIDDQSQVVHSMLDPTIDPLLIPAAVITGFGGSVSLVPDPADPNTGALAVGLPIGSVGGTALSGGVYVHRWLGTAWEPLPFVVVGGESHLPPGELGSTLRGGVDRGVPTVFVGAHWSHQGGYDRGAAYAAPLD